MSEHPQQTGITQSAGRVLILDSDTMICDLIKYDLENEGYTIDVCHDADMALELDLTTYTLIIAESGPIGPLSGLRFCTMIKSNPDIAGVPVIFCTENDSEDDIINGFNAGADDYILKPFSLREMIARVKAVIRRHNLMNRRAAASRQQLQLPAVFKHQGLTIDLDNQTVDVDNTRVQFSRTEFQILSILMKNPGRIYPRSEIFEIIRPGQEGGNDRTIDVNVSRIRKKLGDYSGLIINKSGQGYSFCVK